MRHTKSKMYLILMGLFLITAHSTNTRLTRARFSPSGNRNAKRYCYPGTATNFNETLSCVYLIKQFLLDHTDIFDPQEMLNIQETLDTICDKLNEPTGTTYTHDDSMHSLYQTICATLELLKQQLAILNTGCNVDGLYAKLDELTYLIHNIEANCCHPLEDFHATWTTLGHIDDTSVDPTTLTTPYDIDCAPLSVIQWLKTIYRKLCCPL